MKISFSEFLNEMDHSDLDPYGEEDWTIDKKTIIKFNRPLKIELYFGYFNHDDDWFNEWTVRKEDLSIEWEVDIMKPGKDYNSHEHWDDRTLIKVDIEGRSAIGWIPNDAFEIVD